MTKSITTTLLLTLFALALQAAQPAPILGKKVDLLSGTTVLLELAESLSSEQMTAGQLVQFKVTTDVVVDGRVAIRTGALAWGRIKGIDKPTYNNPAQLRLEVQHVQAVDGQQIKLNGAEQTLRGKFSSQGFQAQPGTTIMTTVMNDNEVKTK